MLNISQGSYQLSISTAAKKELPLLYNSTTLSVDRPFVTVKMIGQAYIASVIYEGHTTAEALQAYHYDADTGMLLGIGLSVPGYDTCRSGDFYRIVFSSSCICFFLFSRYFLIFNLIPALFFKHLAHLCLVIFSFSYDENVKK